MADFKRSGGGRFGGNRNSGGRFRDGGGRSNFSRGGRGGSDGRGRGPVTMHQAVCDQCGKTCEVPFRPTGDKPVYCDNCFQGKKEIGNSREGDRFQGGSFDNRGTSTRTGFSNSVNRGNNEDGEVKKQLELLNEKIDQLIEAVEARAGAKPRIVKKTVEEEVETAPVMVKEKKTAKRVPKKAEK